MGNYESNQGYTDKAIICCDCGTEFCWTSGEQRYYNDKGLAPVKRCPQCRETRRRTIHPPVDSDKAIAKAKSLFPNDYPQGASDG